MAGANINAVDANGNSALFRASSQGNAAVVRALLDAGADPTAVGQDGMHPLHVACMCGGVEVVAMLLLAGADVHATTASGHTARDIAVERNRQDCVDVIDRHLGDFGIGYLCDVGLAWHFSRFLFVIYYLAPLRSLSVVHGCLGWRRC